MVVEVGVGVASGGLGVIGVAVTPGVVGGVGEGSGVSPSSGVVNGGGNGVGVLPIRGSIVIRRSTKVLGGDMGDRGSYAAQPTKSNPTNVMPLICLFI